MSRSISPNPIQVDLVIDADISHPIDRDALAQGARAAAHFAGYTLGQIGIRITDDATIQRLNQKHLDHDYATDVISFRYVNQPPEISGEMVVSIDTAIRESRAAGWRAEQELLLYVVHGTLHVAGMEDDAPSERSKMRRAECDIMTALGHESINRCGADQCRDDRVCEDVSSQPLTEDAS